MLAVFILNSVRLWAFFFLRLVLLGGRFGWGAVELTVNLYTAVWDHFLILLRM